MSDYRKKVRIAASERSGTLLYNSSLIHAAVLTEALFENADDCVRILSGKLNAHVYGQSGVIEKARLFLADPNHRIMVLLESPQDLDKKDHPFYTAFESNDDVEFRAMGDSFIPPDYHFTVMDDDSYRFEKDKNEPNAIAAFGNKETARNLTEIFDIFWNDSVALN